MNEVEVKRRVNEVREVRTRRRQKWSETKDKKGISKNKDKCRTRFFSVSCDDLGPGSNDKIDQVIKERKR